MRYVLSILLFAFLLTGCGSHNDPSPPAIQPDPCGGNAMLTLNDNFKAALLEQPNKPAFLVKLVQSEVMNDLSSQSDWLAGRSIGVDLTTEPGSILIPSTTPTGITQNAYNTTLCLGSLSYNWLVPGLFSSPATPGTDSFVWQSFKQSSGQNRYVNKVRPHLYATGTKSQYNAGWFNYFYVQLFDSKNGTAISTLKTIGGADYAVDGQVEVDFSSENIPLTSGTTYWMKIYSLSTVYVSSFEFSYATAAAYVRYHSTTSTYADGQMDGKAYNAAESVNCGDLAFTMTFLNQYAGTGFVTNMIDLGAAPTVPGEILIDKLTPQDSYVNTRVQMFTAIDSVELSTVSSGSGTSWEGIADNGYRLVRVSSHSPYMQWSDDRGATWTDSTGNVFSSQAIVWTGTRWVAVGVSSTTSGYSYDGKVWYSGGSLPASGVWIRIVWTGTTCFAIMKNGQGATSVDGGTWVARTMAPSNKAWVALGWNGIQLLAIATGTDYAATSDAAGASWTPQTMASSDNWQTVAWGADKWVAVANNSTGVNISADGAAWSSESRTVSSLINKLVFNGFLFVGVGQYFEYSEDGITWMQVATDLNGSDALPVDGRILVLSYISTVDAVKALSHPGHVDLGLLSDGDALPAGYRYASVTNYVAPDSNGVWTPSLRSVTLFFPDWLIFSSRNGFGYEAAVNSVAALQTSIDTFEETKVGQITINLALTQTVSNWLATCHPRNKEVRIYVGFVGLAEADFVSYYQGSVGDWGIDENFTVSIPIQDFSKIWKGVPVPATWQTAGAPPGGDDRVYTAVHHVDIMLDILQGDIGSSSRALSGSSFGVVKNELSGWVASNTLTRKTFDAKELLEQLRFITGTYFIPQSDGRTKLKRWDPDEAAVASITDAEMLSCKHKGNSAKLKNLINWYYNIDTEGVAKSGGIALYQTQDGQSRSDNKETKIIPFDDHWTLTAEGPTQVQPVANALLTRYAAIPDGFDTETDLRFFALELADMISLTTIKAPSTDLTGISNVKYQIVRRNLDFLNNKIKLELLRA